VLRPADLRSAELPRALRGYDVEATRNLLEEAANELKAVVLKRDQLAEEVGRLEEQLAASAHPAVTEGDQERAIGEALVAATRAAEELRAQAQHQAEEAIAEGHARAREIIAMTERESEAAKAEAERQAQALVDKAKSEARDILSAAEQRQRDSEEESKRKAEDAVAEGYARGREIIAVTERETEAARAEAEKQAQALISKAKREAEKILGAGEQQRKDLHAEAERLRALTDQTAADLRASVHAMLEKLEGSGRPEDAPPSRAADQESEQAHEAPPASFLEQIRPSAGQRRGRGRR
jgi:cell division septum initiation protein DivIVA